MTWRMTVASQEEEAAVIRGKRTVSKQAPKGQGGHTERQGRSSHGWGDMGGQQDGVQGLHCSSPCLVVTHPVD